MNIKINDKFYRYIDCGGVFQYVVKGVRRYESDEQYELECQTCNHGEKCLLLCAVDDYKKLQFIKMLNDDDNEQSHWHHGAGQFFATPKEALIDKGARMEREIDKKIIDAKEAVKRLEEQKNKQIKVIMDMCVGLKD